MNNNENAVILLRKLTILVFLPLLFLTGCRSLEKETAPLVPARTTTPQPLVQEKQYDLSRDNSILFKELRNGLRAVVIEMPRSTITYGMISFGVGGRYEPESRAGISHLLEHLLFKEKEGFKPVSAIRRMGGSVNAQTDYELTSYYFTVLPEHFEDAMTALSSMVLEPQFDGKDLASEREVVLEELARGKNDPRALVLASLIKKVFPSSPLSNLVIGNRRSISRITLNDLHEFHDAYYVPGNMIVACAGATDAKQTMQFLEALFGRLKPSPIPDIAFKVPEIAVLNLTKEIPVNQAFYITGILVPGKAGEDYYEMMLLYTLLCSGVNSRLYRKIVIEEGLTEGFFPFRYNLSDTGIWAVMLSISPEDIQMAGQIVNEEINDIKKGRLSEHELEIAKKALTSKLLITHDSPMDLDRFELENLAFRKNILTLQEYIDNLKAVSRHDIVMAARRHLTADNIVTVSLLPAPVQKRWFLMLKLLLTEEL